MKNGFQLKNLLWLPLVAVVFVVYQKVDSRIPAESYTVSRGVVVSEVAGTGTLEARVGTTISARIQERLAEVLVDQGDRVKKGQLVARLDDSELGQQVRMAGAALDAARKTLVRVRADLARAEAVLDQARLEHERLTGLVAARAVSRSDLDKALESLRVAEADVARSNAAIAEADAQVDVADKTVQYHKERLGFTEIRAPYDGLIVRRDRDAGGIAVPGASLMQLVSLDEIWVRAWMDESVVSRIAVGQAANVEFRSLAGKSFAGKVRRIGRENDRETREFLVDVGLVELPGNWVLGQRAEVVVETSRVGDAVRVPQSFIQWDKGSQGVWINRGGRAEWRAIRTGVSGGGFVEVAGGLEPGQEILRAPGGSNVPLEHGQRVKIQ